jgi:hypothetical protein
LQKGVAKVSAQVSAIATSKGKVYVASMNCRGAWAERPGGATIVNVTSGQGKESKNHHDFSPTTESNYKGFYNFETF